MKLIFQQDVPERVDKFIAQNLPDFSREFCKKLIENRLITVNGKFVRPSHKLQKNDIIEISDDIEKSSCTLLPDTGNLEILYEDEHIIVVNKPAGILTHPVPGQTRKTLVNLILAHTALSSIGLPLRPGVVHRLDRDTSGCIIFAKTEKAHLNLVEQFKNRTIKKTYRAVVSGLFSKEIKEISVPLYVEKNGSGRVSVKFGRGKEAKTEIYVIGAGKNATYIEARPITGRTHQIRVSLAFIGHPVLGDIKYGRPSVLIERQALHAYSISFSHPETREIITCTARIPEDMVILLEQLGIAD
ncbi:MAG: RluA family pseudouridine synthase [Candidatus Ratteibacteria bacterium]